MQRQIDLASGHSNEASRRALLSWPLLLGALAYLGVLIGGYASGVGLADPDPLWHIAAGQYILDNGRIPFTDPFSFTRFGAPWEPIEWLSQVILAVAYRAGGFAAVLALAATATALAIAILTRALLRKLEPIYALLFAVMAFMAALSHPHARPHLLVMPLLVFWAAKMIEAADQSRAPSLALLPLMTLWANMHSSFTLGLGLAGVFAAEALLAARTWPERLNAARGWGVFGLLALAAGMLTPLALDGVLFTFRTMGERYMLSTIGEWRSPDFQSLWYVELWLLIVIGAALLGGIRLPPVRAVLVLMLFYMMLRHGRYFVMLAMLLPLIAAGALARRVERRAAAQDVAALDRLLLRLAGPAPPGAVAATASSLAAASLLMSAVSVLEPSPRIAPRAALEAVSASGISGRVFNHYDYGGFLIFAGIPVFVDGRTPIYGDEFLRDTFSATSLANPDRLPQILEEWDIAWTLLPARAPAAAYLDQLGGWRRLYADDHVVVHARVP